MSALSSVDISNMLVPAAQVVGMVVAALAVPLANRAMRVFEQRTHMQLSDHQIQAVHDAAQTGAGVLSAELAKGALQLADLHINNPVVKMLAAKAMDAVPAAVGALGLTVPDVAHMIIGKVGDMLSADPTVLGVVSNATPAPTVAPPAPTPA